MKKLIIAGCACLVVGLALMPLIGDETERSSSIRPVADISKKIYTDTDGEINVDVGVAFSGGWGETITDENGTYYNICGWTMFEPKVYPPEYWGVFPLYFFNDTVGVTLALQNQGDTRAKVRIRTECYCLGTDGASGAELMAPSEREAAADVGTTENVDASFVCEYTPEADSGLDRFLVKVMNPDAADPNNGAHTITGNLNLGPGNSGDNAFLLTLANGTTITRAGVYSYNGPASRLYFKPKGNGNQNSLVVDGVAYTLRNSETYNIISHQMTINLWNANMQNDKAMGQWWITMNASSATILKVADDEPLLVQKEAIFCPPELNGELTQAVRAVVE